MRKSLRIITIGLGLIALLAVGPAFIVIIHHDWKSYPNIDLASLTHDEPIVGVWGRVALRRNDTTDTCYQISASGKIATRHDDMILRGSYKILDQQTIEIRFHFHSEADIVERWTFGFVDGRLIMVNQSNGVVVGFKRLPPGTREKWFND
jgi:hypothetical protein